MFITDCANSFVRNEGMNRNGGIVIPTASDAEACIAACRALPSVDCAAIDFNGGAAAAERCFRHTSATAMNLLMENSPVDHYMRTDLCPVSSTTGTYILLREAYIWKRISPYYRLLFSHFIVQSI